MAEQNPLESGRFEDACFHEAGYSVVVHWFQPKDGSDGSVDGIAPDDPIRFHLLDD